MRRSFFLVSILGLFLSACGASTQSAPTLAPLSGFGSVIQEPTLRPAIRETSPVGDIYPRLGPVTGNQLDNAQIASGTGGSSESTPVLRAQATATFGSVVIDQAATLTPTPTPTAAGTPTRSPFGAIVGPNYTPPPTLTVAPTGTFPAASGTLPPVITPGPSPTPGPSLRSDLMGIQIHGFLTDAEFAQMLDHAASLGVRWIKLQIDWSLFEPEPGQYNEFFRAKILNVQRASLRGFKTLLSFAKAPDWARPASARGVESGPPDSPAELAKFVAKFIRDTKPEFVDAVEIWNEPNLNREWMGKPITGATYMAYFRATYAAILEEQRAQPSALKPGHRITVLTAAPAPTITFAGQTLGDREWLQQLYDAGLAQIGDDVALSVHPYGWANPPDALCCRAASGVSGWYEHPSFYFRETLNAYRDIMIRNKHESGKLWVTEFGWASLEGLTRSDGGPMQVNDSLGWMRILNQQQQAEYVLRAFALAQQPPYYEFLGPMILWNLNFALIPKAVDEGSDGAGFGLLDARGQPRPIYQALRNAVKTEPGR